MPRIEPATAVANSQRKNSWPSSIRLFEAHLVRLDVRPRAFDGDKALPLLAGGLGEQLLHPEVETARDLRQRDLVAALAPAVAERETQLEAGAAVARTGTPRASRRLARGARRTSRPMSAAGAIPNTDSAE